MTRTKLTAVLCTVAATVATAVLAGAAASHADERSRAGTPANHPTHFAGFPAVGVKASTPTTGKLLIGLRPTANTEWNVYADGRIIWQKWTLGRRRHGRSQGSEKARHGLRPAAAHPPGCATTPVEDPCDRPVRAQPHARCRERQRRVFHQVRVGDRMVTVDGMASPDPTWKQHFTKATPAQTRALASIAALVADPARWLPTSVWADRQIRAFVPARYLVAFDRGYPDLSKLPPPAGKALAQYKHLRRHACQILTTGQARALLQAFVKAGITPSENHAWIIAFDLAGLPGQPHPSYLHLSPALPDGCF